MNPTDQNNQIDTVDIPQQPVEIPQGEQGDFAPQAQQAKTPSKRFDKIINLLLVIVIVGLLSMVLFKSFIQTKVVVSGDSMLDTYYSGQVVTVKRIASQKNVNRGDVVVFYVEHPGWFAEHFNFFGGNGESNPNRLLIKRVVALSGDKIWVEAANGRWLVKVQTADGTIIEENYYTLDGKPLDQGNFAISTDTLKVLADKTQSNPYVVPQDCFFAMGDNRDKSNDSRYSMGAISFDNLFGIVK